MNKIILIFISILLFSCSLNENSKIWNKKDKNIDKDKKQKVILVEEKKLEELNPLVSLDLSKTKHKNKINNNLNDFGSLKYNGSLAKIAKYKFSKIKNFNQFNFAPLILNDGLIVFDNC